MSQMADPERERENSPPPPPPEHAAEAAKPNALETASAMGNQAVAKVAGSPELQQNPAAAGLMGTQSSANEAAGAGGGGAAALEDAAEEMTNEHDEHP